MLPEFPWDTSKITIWSHPYYKHNNTGKAAACHIFMRAFNKKRIIYHSTHDFPVPDVFICYFPLHSVLSFQVSTDNHRRKDLPPYSPFARHCVLTADSDAATKAGATRPIARSLQQKLNTIRRAQALKHSFLLHDATCFKFTVIQLVTKINRFYRTKTFTRQFCNRQYASLV